jgi:hypothetical protein
MRVKRKTALFPEENSAGKKRQTAPFQAESALWAVLCERSGQNRRFQPSCPIPAGNRKSLTRAFFMSSAWDKTDKIVNWPLTTPKSLCGDHTGGITTKTRCEKQGFSGKFQSASGREGSNSNFRKTLKNTF